MVLKSCARPSKQPMLLTMYNKTMGCLEFLPHGFKTMHMVYVQGQHFFRIIQFLIFYYFVK